MRSTHEILNHHLKAFGNNDLEAILKDYNEQSEIFTVDGVVRGLEAIRKFFEEFFRVIPTGSVFEMKQLIVSDRLAYIVWSSKSEAAEIVFGTDTFVIEEDKIVFHSVADHRIN